MFVISKYFTELKFEMFELNFISGQLLNCQTSSNIIALLHVIGICNTGLVMRPKCMESPKVSTGQKVQ